MIIPMIITTAPVAMDLRRPYRSEIVAANGAPHMLPLALISDQVAANEGREGAHTVYREKMTEVFRFRPALNVCWKCSMARMAVMSEPSYPFAHEQQNETNIATTRVRQTNKKTDGPSQYSLNEDFDHLSSLDSCTAA